MTQTVRVRKVFADGMAEVIHIRQSACSGECHKCSGCGATQETMQLTAKNPIGAKPGDMVIIESQTGPVLKATAIVYMLPLAMFFLGYLVGMTWGKGPLCGCLAFALGIGISILYDRLVAKKEQTVYTITGYAQSDLHGF